MLYQEFPCDFLDCSWFPRCAAVPCSDCAHTKGLKFFQHESQKAFPKCPFSSRTQTLVQLFQRIDVISKMLCPCSGTTCQLPTRSLCRYLAQQLPPALVGGTSRPSKFAVQFSWLAQTSNFKFPNWPTQWECMLPVSSFSGKAHEHSSTLCGCFKDIALRFEVHFRFPELAQHAPRVPGCIDSCFPLLWRRTRSRSGHLTVVFETAARIHCRAACAKPICTDFDPSLAPQRHSPLSAVQCPSPPLPCRPVCSPALPPPKSSKHHLQFGSPLAQAGPRCNSVESRHVLPGTFSAGLPSVVNILAHQHRVSHSTPPLGQVLLPPGSAFVGMPGGVPSGFVHAHACPWVFSSVHVHPAYPLSWLYPAVPPSVLAKVEA